MYESSKSLHLQEDNKSVLQGFALHVPLISYICECTACKFIHPALQCLDSITVRVTCNYRMAVSDGVSLEANIPRLAFLIDLLTRER